MCWVWKHKIQMFCWYRKMLLLLSTATLKISRWWLKDKCSILTSFSTIELSSINMFGGQSEIWNEGFRAILHQSFYRVWFIPNDWYPYLIMTLIVIWVIYIWYPYRMHIAAYDLFPSKNHASQGCKTIVNSWWGNAQIPKTYSSDSVIYITFYISICV